MPSSPLVSWPCVLGKAACAWSHARYEVVSDVHLIFKPRLIWTIVTSVFIQVFVYSLILHYVLENYGPRLAAVTKNLP